MLCNADRLSWRSAGTRRLWLAWVAMVAAAPGAYAQTDSVPVRPGPASALLIRLLRSGQRAVYEGEQVTQTFGRQPTETRQIVKYAGPGRQRIEYVHPPDMKGEVILIAGRRVLHYIPGESPRVVEGGGAEASEGLFAQVVTAVRTGRLRVRMLGNQIVAGRPATIVEIRAGPKAPFRRLWLDVATGVRLRHENVANDGRVMAASYFTRIAYNPVLRGDEFRPDALPAADREIRIPTSPPLESIAEAERLAGFTVAVPEAPAGYAFQGAWVLGRGIARTVLLRYSDGVNSFYLSQRPVPPALRSGLGANPGPWRGRRGGLVMWTSGGRLFSLFGDLRPEIVRAVRRSLEPKRP